MHKSGKHIVWALANCSTAPYFTWFAKRFSEQKSDDKLSFVCMFPTMPLMVKEMRALGLECHWIKYDFNHRKSGLLRSSWQLFKLFRKIKPDIVNSHLFDDSLAAMVAAKLTDVPQRIVTKGDAGFHYYFAPKWVFFDRLINRLSTKVIAISGENQQLILQKEKANPKKVTMIHHGIPLDTYSAPNTDFVKQFKNEYSLNDKFVIGTVARFIEWKGYKTVVEVAKILAPQIPNICFLLIGKGEQREEIISLIKANKLEKHFCLPGYIQPENMPSVYGAMDVYLHAAKMEPFGFVIAEALAAGLPVVSTPTGAALDAIQTGVNGWLGEYNQSGSLAQPIIEIKSKNIQVPWQPAVDAARQYYTFELMFQNYIKLYNTKNQTKNEKRD